MFSEGNFLISDSDDFDQTIDMSLHDVSISSIKTQDSIENNPMRIVDADEEDRKDSFVESFHNGRLLSSLPSSVPFMNLKDTRQALVNALANPRKRLEIKSLHDILDKMNKISEDCQIWRKQD